ncbi:hypothetical protein, partial [Methanoculleus sp. UBA208]
MPESDEEILKHIARRGPSDAWGTHKALGMNLSTAQNAKKRLLEKGLICLVGERLSEKMQVKRLFGLTLQGLSVAISMIDRDFILSHPDGFRKYERGEFCQLTDDHSRGVSKILVQYRGLHWIFDEISKIYQEDIDIAVSYGGWSNILSGVRSGLSIIDPRRTIDDLPIEILLSDSVSLLNEGRFDLAFEDGFFRYIASQWKPSEGEHPAESKLAFLESLAILEKSE